MKKITLLVLGLIGCFWGVKEVVAHANLVRSNPPANTVLSESPTEIRLWFTEPLEPDFSSIELVNSSGETVATPASQLDSSDPLQMFIALDEPLPDGLYTVIWSVVSASDGHPTDGYYPFSIGVPLTGDGYTPPPAPIPVRGVAVRWLTFFSMALVIGGLGFRLWVWHEPDTNIENRQHRLIIVGWLLMGVSAGWGLVYQTTTISTFSADSLQLVIQETRYGMLWQLGMGLWIILGGLLVRRWYLPALVVSIALLGRISLISHAYASPVEQILATFSDWVHLFVMALWVGGLAQFANVLWGLRRQETPVASVSRLVGQFSNLMRISVLALIVTGIYAAWLHITELDMLWETRYGKALLVKLVLTTPLLLVAAVNLVGTQRALSAGREWWVRRLQGLVGVEIALTLLILVATGVLTSTNPNADTPPPAAPITQPVQLMYMGTEGLHAHLDVIPGTVGENQFKLTLSQDMDGLLKITDASLIRMRFQTLGGSESELRPTLQPDGTYAVSGANISLPGDWRIRMTVARPGEFDQIIDFNQTFNPPPPAPEAEIEEPQGVPMAVLLGLGLVACVCGGFFAVRQRHLLALVVIAVGVAMLMQAVFF